MSKISTVFIFDFILSSCNYLIISSKKIDSFSAGSLVRARSSSFNPADTPPRPNIEQSSSNCVLASTSWPSFPLSNRGMPQDLPPSFTRLLHSFCYFHLDCLWNYALSLCFSKRRRGWFCFLPGAHGMDTVVCLRNASNCPC